MKHQKRSSTSKIRPVVYEMALDLHRQGAIGTTTLQKYEDLCLKPTDSSGELRTLRPRYQLTQTQLASLLKVSPATVRSWEGGTKQPRGPSVRLLNLLERQGIEILR
jgi:putative transcriptional regulator